MPPNVLIIQADQFRADCFGAAGHPDVRTPALDRLKVSTAPSTPQQRSWPNRTYERLTT